MTPDEINFSRCVEVLAHAKATANIAQTCRTFGIPRTTYYRWADRAGASVVITANRATTDWCSLFPNPVVAESILDRLVNGARHIAMPGRSYRPNRHPGAGARS